MSTNWDEYVLTQEALSSACARQVQGMMDDYGMSIDRAHELAQMDMSAIDPALLQEVQMATGMKLEEIPSSKPGPTASYFRQRTRALAV